MLPKNSKPEKVESIFENNQEQTVSEAVGTNHKGQTDMLFQGLSMTNDRFHIMNLQHQL